MATSIVVEISFETIVELNAIPSIWKLQKFTQ